MPLHRQLESDSPPSATTATTPAGTRKTVRERVFDTLSKAPSEGLSNKEIRQLSAIKGEGGVSAMLRDECSAKKPRIMVIDSLEEDRKGTRRYRLTARGRKALKDGTVNSQAPTRREWDEARLDLDMG